MPAFWLAVAAVTTATTNGPMNEVTWALSANRPKNWVSRSAGASRASKVREEACPIRAPRGSP
jgi:hypothetical protein